MITASNFGLIVKRRENTSTAKLVETILYKSNLSNIAAVAHGIENEHLALQQLATQEKVDIKPCGLFVDHDYPFIGATPDGLIGEDTLIEIKCPIVAFKNGLEESIKNNKIQIWRYNKKSKLIDLNKNCNWYHQIQGQLHVARREKCLFAVWSGDSKLLKTEIIKRDVTFWEKKIKEKLLTFYMDWLLPEIVDSRRARGMPLREQEPSVRKSYDDSAPKEVRERGGSKEKEHPPQTPPRQQIFEPACSDDNKENENVCCIRQLNFDEF